MKNRNHLTSIFCMALCLALFYCGKDQAPDVDANTDKTEEIRNTDPNRVILATLDWEPYIGETIPGYGYVYELVVEAFRRAGIITRIKFYPWPRAVELSKSGRINGYFPEYFDESRLQHWMFSEPFPGGPVGLFKRTDRNIRYGVDPRISQIEALKTLKQYKIGVVKDYINTRDFDRAAGLNIPAGTPSGIKEKIENEKFIRVDFSDNDEQNIRKLYRGRIDLIFIDKYVADYLIKTRLKEYEGKLEFMEPALQYNPLYVCFSKKAPDHQKKLSDFNRGLKQMKDDGTLKQIIQKYGF